MGRHLRERFRSQRGAELVEMALVLPLLLLLIAGIIDFGLLFQRYLVLTNAAREGARIAVLPGYSTTDAKARVQNYVQVGLNKTIDANSVSVTLVDIGPDKGVRVGVSMDYNYIILGPVAALISDSSSFTKVTLTGVSVMRLEIGG